MVLKFEQLGNFKNKLQFWNRSWAATTLSYVKFHAEHDGEIRLVWYEELRFLWGKRIWV